MSGSHRFACAAALAWLACATLLAQSDGPGRISGRVVDARTGAGLARVLILVEFLGEAVRWRLTAFDREEDGFFRRIGAETRLMGGRVVRGALPTRTLALRLVRAESRALPK